MTLWVSTLVLGLASCIAADTSVLLLDGSDWLLHGNTGSQPITNATVPGGIWDNLHRAGHIGNPLCNSCRGALAHSTVDRTNDVVYANMTRTNAPHTRWTFEKLFNVSTEHVGSVATLELLGIQTLSSVLLNGVPLIETSNMFRLYTATIPAGILKASGNRLKIELAPTYVNLMCAGHPQAPGFCGEAAYRTESDTWGWDWSPNLSPMAVYKSVRIVLPGATPYISSFIPRVHVVETNDTSKEPIAFKVTAQVEVVVPANVADEASRASLVIFGDWGETVELALDYLSPVNGLVTVQASGELMATVPGVQLWWPLHYGKPHLHNITATLNLRDSTTPTVSSVSKLIGFRSVGLYTGPPAPQQPARIDPTHAAAHLGCFRDGNPWWGGKQHALAHLAAHDATMTVPMCIGMCSKAGYKLAGLQKGTWCYCGNEVGETCQGCLPLTGTRGDPSECGWPCGGDPSIACGGATYMWNSNSVYNVTELTTRTWRKPAPVPPPPSTEGSGDSAFAIVINGVKVFSRGGNLVPFEILEATVDPAYIRRTVQSARDGNMNMIRVWGGGMWQDDVFYEECDKQGILVYHDMMFSFRFYPHNETFQANVKAELEYQINRLVHHPSIVLWDSSNENEGDPEFFYETVLETVVSIDNSRPLWPASPSSGFSAGVHTDTGLPNGNPLVGRYQETLDTHMPYNFCDASFVTSTSLNHSFNPSQPNSPTTYFKSEFGQVGLPAFETLKDALSGAQGDYGIYSPTMIHRKHAGIELEKPIVALFGNTSQFTIDDFHNVSESNFRRVSYLSQLAQTLCIKTVFEELRRGINTFGGLIWQLNDVWQASSWGSLDYGGRWRALHHSMQATLAPTMISIWTNESQVNVFVSHHGEQETSLQVEVNITDISDGKALESHVLPWTASHTAQIEQLLQLPLSKISAKHQIISTRVFSQGKALQSSETVNLLLPPEDIKWAAVSTNSVSLKVTGLTVTIDNRATTPLFYMMLTSTLSGRFSNNLLYVPPGTTRAISFLPSAKANVPSASQLRDSLSVEWLNRARD